MVRSMLRRIPGRSVVLCELYNWREYRSSFVRLPVDELTYHNLHFIKRETDKVIEVLLSLHHTAAFCSSELARAKIV
jgi:hypothetical protein